MAWLLAALCVIALLTHEEEDPRRPAAPLPEIAARVEALRGVRFESIPSPRTVTAAQAREEGLADLEKGYPAAEREADEALYETLGLLPRDTDLREVSASVFGEQVAGYYDPRDGRLRIVEDAAGGGNRVIDEMVLSHELTHALEDQAFGLDTDAAESSGDSGYAYRALVEGTATVLMYDYVERHFRGEEILGGLLSSSLSVSSTTPLPRFVIEGLTFPYLEGAKFARELRERAGGSWRLLDVALKGRAPLSTEQVLHPEKWLAVELPVEVSVDGVGEALGEGWRRAARGVFGEWQTAQLVLLGGPVRPEAAAGWGGDRYELWRHGDESVVVVRWVWDSAAEAREFEAAMRPALGELGSPARLDVRGRESVLVAGAAPDPQAVAARVLGASGG